MSKIAIPLADDFEDAEFDIPYTRLREAGHETVVVGKEAGAELTGKRDDVTATVDEAAADVDADDFDAVVIPGGYSPDKLRLDEDVVGLVSSANLQGKLIAAICHAGSLLIEARAIQQRTLTSWPSIRTDLELAGANWIDEPVVEDTNLITSRKPDDLDAFCDAILGRLPKAEAA